MALSTARPEVKAAALADLMTGEQPAVVAERYKLPRDTVKSWKRRLDLRAGAPSAPAPDAPIAPGAPAPAARVSTTFSLQEQQARVVGLVYENLIAKLEATKKLAEHAARDEWLSRQSAEGVAVLGGWLDSTARATLELLAHPRGDDAPAE